jgi:hypothetical protein
VINTSFNLAGEPIVHSARDAVETFLRSELDVLVLGDLVAVKAAAKERVGAPEAQTQRRQSANGGHRLFPWVGSEP